MGQFFGTISDETAAEFEKAAAAGGMEYQGDLEALRFLHYGGYCGFTSMAQQLFLRMWQRHMMN